MKSVTLDMQIKLKWNVCWSFVGCARFIPLYDRMRMLFIAKKNLRVLL